MVSICCRKLSIHLNLFFENQITLFEVPVTFEKIPASSSLIGQYTLGFWVLITGFIPNDIFAVIGYRLGKNHSWAIRLVQY